MKKQMKKLVLAKETLACLGAVRGGYLGDLESPDQEYSKTCITCFASCERTDCYCPASDACSDSCICVPF
jgi:hypothetical protein